jgi:GPH family glycoside/pentoside/hexuronide:cation symporter
MTLRSSAARAAPGEIVTYGIGDLAFNLIWTTMLTYLVYYYTETCGIRAEVAGLIVLGARVTNVVLDPLAGVVVDRRQFGRKARPLLMWGAVPLGILTWLAFTTISDDVATRTIWAAVTYCTLCGAYSLVNTPYGAMTTLISDDEAVRGRLAVSRMIGATIGMLLVGMVTLPLVDALGQGSRAAGFSRTAAIYGVLVAGGLLLTGRVCRERAGGDPLRASFGEIVQTLASNRAWLVVTFSMGLNMIGQTFLFGMTPYYVLKVLLRPDGESGLLLTVLNILFLAGSLVALPLALRIGSRMALLLGATGGGVLLLLLDVLPQSMPVTFWTMAAAGLLLGIAAPMSYVLLADSADIDSSGKTVAGVCYAANSAVCKISFGIGGYLMTLLLASEARSTAWLIQRGFVDVSAATFLLSGLILFLYPRIRSREAMAA